LLFSPHNLGNRISTTRRRNVPVPHLPLD
jgi:hypothetical protein